MSEVLKPYQLAVDCTSMMVNVVLTQVLGSHKEDTCASYSPGVRPWRV